MIIDYFINISYELNAQCQQGHTLREINMTIGGCPYKVQLCVYCSAGVAPSEVSVVGFMPIPQTPQCNNNLTANQVLQQIESQVNTWNFIYTYLCSPGLPSAPPCPTQSDFVTFHHWLCWKVECIEYLEDTTWVYTPCDYQNSCDVTYSWCYDPILGYVRTIQSGPTLVGSVNCSLEGYKITIPTIPGNSSECYIYHTECNPN